jgi:hypothetical protein
MQLDIFNDSRDTMLRNDVVVALMRRDAAAAVASLGMLCDEYPADESRVPLAVLIDAMAQTPTTGFADHAELRDASGVMASQVVPAAVRMLGDHDGRAWLGPLWCAMAQRAVRLPNKPHWSDAHAAPLWIQAREWDRAIASAERIESWRRIPAPLAWMAEARFRSNGLDRTWDLLIELAWLAPERLDRLMGTIADPLLQRLRRKFDASWEGEGTASDLAWFPAWVLTEQPSLVRLFSTAQHAQRTPPEAAMRLLANILELERQGRQHDLIARRKELLDGFPLLYAPYMRTR